jgi:hypothetical protein
VKEVRVCVLESGTVVNVVLREDGSAFVPWHGTLPSWRDVVEHFKEVGDPVVDWGEG